MTTESITSAALALPPESRAELVDTLLRSLNPLEAGFQKAWEDEAEDRLAAFDRGEMKSISREEVMEARRPKTGS
ncbi:MAG: addiction module protein [Pirellulaceae bacterium]